MGGVTYQPGPFASTLTGERPDLLAMLPDSVERVNVETFDFDRAIGLAVTFKGSGYRHAVKAMAMNDAIEALRDYISEYPHGRNPRGVAWEPRDASASGCSTDG